MRCDKSLPCPSSLSLSMIRHNGVHGGGGGVWGDGPVDGWVMLMRMKEWERKGVTLNFALSPLLIPSFRNRDCRVQVGSGWRKKKSLDARMGKGRGNKAAE